MGSSLASTPKVGWPPRNRSQFAMGLTLIAGLLCTMPLASGQTIKTTGERKVISRVQVIYPKVAQQMRLRGTVKVSASVAPTGKVVRTDLIGGSPIFVPYALNAVSLMKWEARPKETTEIVEIDFLPTVRY